MKNLNAYISRIYPYKRLKFSGLLKMKSKIVLLFTVFLFFTESGFGQCSGPNWVPYSYCGGPSNGCYPSGYVVKYNGNYYKSKSNYNGNVPTNTGWWTKLTCASKPTITTTNISSITCNSASSGGTSINPNGASVTAKGVCWSTSSNPTISNSKTTNGTGTSNFTSSITGLSPGTTYYVRAYATNSAGTGYGAQKTFTTSFLNTGSIPSTSSSPITICQGSTPTIPSSSDASGESGIYYLWQYKYSTNGGSTWSGWSDASGTNNNSTYTIPNNLTPGHRHRFRRKAGGTCTSLGWSANASDYYVTTAPSAGTLSGSQTICAGGSSTFSSTVSGGTWSSSNTGIATINSSTGVISGVSAGTATMTYTKAGTGGCSNATATRTVTVTAAPTVGTVVGATRCGTGTAQIKADVSAGTVKWWSASSGGTLKGTSGDNALWTTPLISATTTYYAEAINGSCVSSSRTAVTATVNVNPSVTVSTQPKCGNVGDMIFTFPDESSRTNIEFSINNGSTYIYNTADNVGSYTASSLAPGNYEVWTRWGNGECPVDLGTITITGNVTPSITSSSSGSRCNSGTVDISATSSAGSIDWYTSSTGGSSIGSSNSAINWTTPPISSTTTYYAEGVNGSCISSSRTAVTATVNTASIGPGGVTDELLVWLKADDASLSSTWQDHSCNGFDYSTVSGPTLVNNCWNDNPAIEILSGGFDAPAGAELGTEWTVFFVSALKSSDKSGRLIEGHTGNYLLGYYGGYRNSIYWNGGSAAEHNSGIATQLDVESPHIFMYKRENTGGNIITKINGDYKKTFTSTNSGSGIRLDINQGNYKNTESTHSRIGEFIIYNKTLSDAEVRKVEAYLATKYGIVLSDDDGGTGGDYISTGGTTYWDASARSGYTNDVVVIGKDNSTALTQKQAKSKDDSLKVFISSLASNNSANSGSITNDESFIAIGHNGGKLKTSTSANTEKPAGVFSRFEREWCLTNTNFTDDFSLKVEWDSAGTFDINDIRLLVDDDGDFSNASVYGSADGLTFNIGSIIIGGVSSSMFPSGDTKYFTLASSSESTPLPIELLYFTANEEEGYIILNWETAMEINNDYFIVEKSIDGNNWEQITTVPGAGISTSSITYVYVDKDICENTCYYRLTQVDYDGTSETFKTIRVNADIYNDVINMEVVPNPVSSKVNVSVNAYENGISYFKVLNIQGDLIYTATVPIYKGVNYFDINMSIYESGTYYFNIQLESGQTKTVPVVKK